MTQPPNPERRARTARLWAQVERIRTARATGASFEDIAALFGCSPNTIVGIVRRNGGDPLGRSTERKSA